MPLHCEHDIIEQRSSGFQNHLHALKGVLNLLANVSADFTGDGVPAGLTGDKHQIAKPRRR
jgi:hypothetical protein